MAVICGLPAYGKTELARRFAHYCKENNLVRKVLWLNADTPSIFEQSLRDLLRWLGAKVQAKLDVQSVVQAVQQHFKAESHLFVLDNALDRRNVLGFEPEGECRCVFTSHLEDWGDDVPPLKLMPLSTDSAVEVLRAELLHRFQDEDLEQYKHLAELLSCVPLALQVAAAYIRQEIDDLGELFHLCDYVQQLQDPSAGAELIDQPLPNFSENPYDKTLLQAIQISLHKINTTNNYDSKLTTDILHICAYLNPEQIFYSTLLEIPFLKSSKNHFIKSCKLLCKYSFITVENKQISIHRLLQKILCQISGNQEMYLICLGLLLENSENYIIHSNFILKYAQYRLEMFNKFYAKYKLEIINNDIFFWHIINTNCKIFLTKILDDLGDGAANVINARCLLHCAVKCKQHKILQLLLLKSYKPDVNKQDEHKCTALALAARMFDLFAMKTLACCKADVNTVAGNGNPVLHEVILASGAAQNIGRSLDAVVAVRRLVELGARTDAVDTRDMSHVHQASSALNPDLVQYLVKNHDCKVNAVDIYKRTPLYYVISFSVDRRRQQDTVRCLLDLGARRDVKDCKGNTASQHAQKLGHNHLADYIENPLTEIQESEPVVDELRSAVARGDVSSVSRLLEELGERALQVCNESGLLIEAVEHKQYDVLEMLLARGADVNSRITTTPLNRAAWNLDMRAMLVDHGADVNATNALGNSVLHTLIVGAGKSSGVDACKALRWLVGRGARTDTVTLEKSSLLHLASHSLSPDLVRCLVTEYSLDMNAVDQAGWTPLYWVSAGLRQRQAEESRGLNTTKCLLELGARVNVLSLKGHTPARIASMNGYTQLATLLKPSVVSQVYGVELVYTGCNTIHVYIGD